MAGTMACGGGAAGEPGKIALPAPAESVGCDLHRALRSRRSVRDFSRAPLNVTDVSQLLWAGQGITAKGRFRTAPSAGALYPLEIYLVAGAVEGLDAGVYRYVAEGHALVRVRSGDGRAALAAAALGQQSVSQGAAAIVIAGVYQRTARKYGERAGRYVEMEAGHAAQNICLEAAALDLGAVVIGAFRDDAVKQVAGLRADEAPLSIIPVGHR
jgi:SagB-type dehydrogenase family enzyme